MLEIIELTARGQSLTSDRVCVASGLVNELRCHFDTDWEIDNLRAVFANTFSGEKIAVVLNDGECNVPHEVLKAKGEVEVNLVGSVLEDDTLVERMTTYRTKIIEVRQRVNLDGQNSDAPTPEEWEQRIEQIESELTEKVEEAPIDDQQYARKNGAWTEVHTSATWDELANKPFNSIGQNLMVENGALKVDTTNTAEEDNTKPITSAGTYVIVGNINSLLEQI